MAHLNNAYLLYQIKIALSTGFCQKPLNLHFVNISPEQQIYRKHAENKASQVSRERSRKGVAGLFYACRPVIDRKGVKSGLGGAEHHACHLARKAVGAAVRDDALIHSQRSAAGYRAYLRLR